MEIEGMEQPQDDHSQVLAVLEGNMLAVMGESKEVEKFLETEGSLERSKPLNPAIVRELGGYSGAALSAAASFSADSGRWVKLTEESAKLVRAKGLMVPKDGKGEFFAMVGKAGHSDKWLRVEDLPGTLNPSTLAAAGPMGTLIAIQHTVEEISAKLDLICEGLDKLSAKIDQAEFSKMAGIWQVVSEAMHRYQRIGLVEEHFVGNITNMRATAKGVEDYTLAQLDNLRSEAETTRLKSLSDLDRVLEDGKKKIDLMVQVLSASQIIQSALDEFTLLGNESKPTEELRARININKELQDKRHGEVFARLQPVVEELNAAMEFAEEQIPLKKKAARAAYHNAKYIRLHIEKMSYFMALDFGECDTEFNKLGWAHFREENATKLLNAALAGEVMLKSAKEKVGNLTPKLPAGMKPKLLGSIKPKFGRKKKEIEKGQED